MKIIDRQEAPAKNRRAQYGNFLPNLSRIACVNAIERISIVADMENDK